MTHRVLITTDWQGKELPEARHIEVTLEVLEAHLRVEVRAPFYANPAPDAPPGSTPKLWEHEVVECFILGEDERYLEMEFGPHGHYLLLELHGERELVRQGMMCDYVARIERGAWHGEARIARELLPPSPTRYNVYAIHALDRERRHMAKFPNHRDEAPNFHRLDTFGHLDISGSRDRHT